MASESEQLHPERCALEEKRDKKRTQLHELRSELRSNKQIIQGANDQVGVIASRLEAISQVLLRYSGDSVRFLVDKLDFNSLVDFHQKP